MLADRQLMHRDPFPVDCRSYTDYHTRCHLARGARLILPTNVSRKLLLTAHRRGESICQRDERHHNMLVASKNWPKRAMGSEGKAHEITHSTAPSIFFALIWIKRGGVLGGRLHFCGVKTMPSFTASLLHRSFCSPLRLHWIIQHGPRVSFPAAPGPAASMPQAREENTG